MKLSYKQKLFLYFFVLFALFTVGIVIFEQSRERTFKTEALEEKLNAYTEIVNTGLSHSNGDKTKVLDSLITMFPKNIRLTLIDKQGTVLYDNAIKDLYALENHLQRPEVASARENVTGVNIRTSTSNNHEYIYYAKRYNSYYIRMALPYDVQVRHFLKADNLFLYYILALLLGALFLINLIASRFGKSIKQLRNFIVAIEKEDLNTFGIDFPDDELGEIGVKIIENYKLLKINKIKIAQEREKLLQHVHSSEEGLCFFSADRRVEFYNGLFIQYLNNIIDGANSEPSSIFTDSSFEVLIHFLSSDSVDRYFETQINKQGKTFSVRIIIFENKDFEVIINDITKQEKTRLLKQEMTSNIAHELRTPVTSIRGYLETVLEKTLDEEKRHYFLTQAYNQTIVLSELIQDMSLITKIEEAPQSFRLEPVNISSLLDGLKNDLMISLNERNIRMDWNIGKDVTVNGNRNLLYSIFRNLTDNVIRYAGSDVQIQISKYNEDESFYYFTYSDNGVGISNDQHLNRLFERFYRINDGRTRDTGGSGLGLSIVKNAIMFHHGTITVKNRLEGGLEFLFKLQKK